MDIICSSTDTAGNNTIDFSNAARPQCGCFSGLAQDTEYPDSTRLVYFFDPQTTLYTVSNMHACTQPNQEIIRLSVPS